MDCLFSQKLTVVGMVKIMGKDLEKRIKIQGMEIPELKKMVLNYNMFVYETKRGYEKSKNEFMDTVIIPDIIGKVRKLKNFDGFVVENWNITRSDDHNRKYTKSELESIKKYGYSIIESKIKTIVFRNNDIDKEYFVETKLRSK